MIFVLQKEGGIFVTNHIKMNKIKQEIEKRKVLNQLRYTSLKEGNFRAYFSESDSHIRKKFELWLKLKKAGYSVWTEAITKKSLRIDVLAFKEGIWTAYEVIESESEASLKEKIKKYPVDVIPIRNMKEIKLLEL